MILFCTTRALKKHHNYMYFSLSNSDHSSKFIADLTKIFYFLYHIHIKLALTDMHVFPIFFSQIWVLDLRHWLWDVIRVIWDLCPVCSSCYWSEEDSRVQDPSQALNGVILRTGRSMNLTLESRARAFPNIISPQVHYISYSKLPSTCPA